MQPGGVYKPILHGTKMSTLCLRPPRFGTNYKPFDTRDGFTEPSNKQDVNIANMVRGLGVSIERARETFLKIVDDKSLEAEFDAIDVARTAFGYVMYKQQTEAAQQLGCPYVYTNELSRGLHGYILRVEGNQSLKAPRFIPEFVKFIEGRICAQKPCSSANMRAVLERIKNEKMYQVARMFFDHRDKDHPTPYVDFVDFVGHIDAYMEKHPTEQVTWERFAAAAYASGRLGRPNADVVQQGDALEKGGGEEKGGSEGEGSPMELDGAKDSPSSGSEESSEKGDVKGGGLPVETGGDEDSSSSGSEESSEKGDGKGEGQLMETDGGEDSSSSGSEESSEKGDGKGKGPQVEPDGDEDSSSSGSEESSKKGDGKGEGQLVETDGGEDSSSSDPDDDEEAALIIKDAYTQQVDALNVLKLLPTHYEDRPYVPYVKEKLDVEMVLRDATAMVETCVLTILKVDEYLFPHAGSNSVTENEFWDATTRLTNVGVFQPGRTRGELESISHDVTNHKGELDDMRKSANAYIVHARKEIANMASFRELLA